jgi:hypothetical protein
MSGRKVEGADAAESSLGNVVNNNTKTWGGETGGCDWRDRKLELQEELETTAY